MFALPIWEAGSGGFPWLNFLGTFLIKDVALLGVSLVILTEGLQRARRLAHRRDQGESFHFHVEIPFVGLAGGKGRGDRPLEREVGMSPREFRTARCFAPCNRSAKALLPGAWR